MKRTALFLFFSLAIASYGQPKLLIRCDDIGMSHAVNMAAKELIESGLSFSASVMFCCPWYQEAVDLLKQHPDISVGIHLTLNAEWKNYRWGPVCGQEAAKSLVDSCGYFFPSRATFFAHGPMLKEVEKELTAQVERAMATGLRIDYIDYHMGTAVEKPEYRRMVEKLAAKHHLGISRYFDEVDARSMYSVPITSKSDSLIAILNGLPHSGTYLIVCHIGKDTEELQAMIDMNPGAPAFMSRHRQAECAALMDPRTLAAVRDRSIALLTYRMLIQEYGLDNMKSPVKSGY
jgi:chitin disaccharide deacetylase